jgi:hypothetical protein
LEAVGFPVDVEVDGQVVGKGTLDEEKIGEHGEEKESPDESDGSIH